jgi:hypothetical protein
MPKSKSRKKKTPKRVLALPGQSLWERYVQLRRLRDASVHFKSRHQWSTAGATFDESPYAYFVQEPPLSIPRAALAVLRYFALPHELVWVDGANAVLERPLEA